MKNTFTGTYDPHVYRGGLLWCAPWKHFYMWPATQVTIEFSNSPNALSGPIRVKCGQGRSYAGAANSGGGQDMSISLAFQFTLVQDKIVDTYLNYTTLTTALTNYQRLARAAVQTAAQEFSAPDYWLRRKTVSNDFLKFVERNLKDYVKVEALEILDLQFAQRFEDQITQVQVSVSKKVINEYKQKVKEIEQQIEILKSNNDAHIKLISSHGQAGAREILANANRAAFNLKQEKKAVMYKLLKNKLGFTTTQMTEYFKIKALQSGPSSISVGVDALDIEGLEEPQTGEL